MIQRRHNIAALLADMQSALVLGPRGSGKSYWVNHILDSGGFKSVLRINLLSAEDFSRYLNNPGILEKEVRVKVSEQPLVVLIDEIQLIPELLNQVHLLIEEFPKQVAFVLTGSSARKLKRTNANLLAGRAIYLPFFPISHLEYDFDLNFDRIMRFGLLPTILDSSKREELIISYLKTYILTYLKEEIQQEALVRNLPAFSRFIELAAQYNGEQVNYSKLARAIGVSANTLQAYYSILEETLIAHSIPAWTHSVKFQLQQAPRYYFFDHGVVRALCGELQSELRESSTRFGAIFESMVVNEIIKTIAICNSDLKLFSFRTESSKEIDLILQSGPFAPPIGVEIKSSKSPMASDVAALKLLRQERPDARLIVLCRCKNSYVDDGIEFEPFSVGIRKLVATDSKAPPRLT